MPLPLQAVAAVTARSAFVVVVLVGDGDLAAEDPAGVVGRAPEDVQIGIGHVEGRPVGQGRVRAHRDLLVGDADALLGLGEQRAPGGRDGRRSGRLRTGRGGAGLGRTCGHGLTGSRRRAARRCRGTWRGGRCRASGGGHGVTGHRVDDRTGDGIHRLARAGIDDGAGRSRPLRQRLDRQGGAAARRHSAQEQGQAERGGTRAQSRCHTVPQATTATASTCEVRHRRRGFLPCDGVNLRSRLGGSTRSAVRVRHDEVVHRQAEGRAAGCCRGTGPRAPCPARSCLTCRRRPPPRRR